MTLSLAEWGLAAAPPTFCELRSLSGTEAESRSRSSGRLSRWLFAALLIAAVVFVVRALAPQTIGEQARRYLECQLQEHYAGFEVSIGEGRYEPSIGLIFEDVRITDPNAPSTGNTWSLGRSRSRDVALIDKLTVVAKTDPEKLLKKTNPLVTQRIVVEGVSADAWLDQEGKLSIQSLWPMPRLGPCAPKLEVRGASLRLIDVAGTAQPITVNVSNLEVVNTTNQGTTGPSAQTTTAQTIRLNASASFASSIQVQADVDASGLDLRASVKRARLDSDLIDMLPAKYRDQCKEIRGLDCLGDIAFALNHPTGGEVDYRLKATIHDGRLDHAKLPQSIKRLSGLILCDPAGVAIQASQGICGDAVCRMSGSVAAYRWPENAKFNVSVSGLRLDDRLVKSIPASLQAGWERLQPSGLIDVVDANLWYQDGRWLNESTIDCKGVDIRYAKFPYPVEQLVGRVSVRGGIARSEIMHGRIGGRRLSCAFHLPTKPEIVSEKAFVVTTDGPIAIDNTLIRSLTPRGESTSKLETFVRSLQPRGLVHMSKASFTTDAAGEKHREFDLYVSDGHLRYQKFAYPLYNVTGKIHVENEHVTLLGFHGTNANAGQIQCDGTYRMPVKAQGANLAMRGRPGGESDSHLQLKFRATNVPMDDSLRSSLPESARITWRAISPSGVLDRMDVLLTQNGAGQPLGLNITGIETESQHVTNRGLSIQPSSLPYRLDITDAHVNFDGDRVSIHHMDVVHGATRMAASGQCTKSQSGRWQLSLDIHSGSRVSPDQELIAALPVQMREAMHRLQLRRPVSIRGKTNFLLTDDQHPLPVIDWDVVLQLEGNRIGDVGPVHALRGEVLARGTSDDRGINSLGEVRIDSMHVNDLQVTNIRGPFSIQGDRLRLGAEITDAAAQTPAGQVLQTTFVPRSGLKKIRGKMFGGDIAMTGEVKLSNASFDVDVSLTHGKVPTLLSDLGHGGSDLTGTISGQTEIEGILGTRDLLKGVGSARVSGANLYQLPLLIQLLNLLRITPTEDVAFTDMDTQFTLIENQMTFNDLKLWGDLVALQGSGTMDRRGELDLTFNTQVSPQNAFTSILRPLRSQRYTLWTVDVRGPLQSPTVERRALDGVGQTLERLFPVMNSREQPVDEGLSR